MDDPEEVLAEAHVARDQQTRLCEVLGTKRYAERWKHIVGTEEGRAELLSSAVRHPFFPEEFLLLHKAAMAEPLTSGQPVCASCKSALLQKPLMLPRFALANDLWIGRCPLPLRDLQEGTKRLLPMIRACVQVTVLQPAGVEQAQRQRGFIGNSIFVPQATPSKIQKVLPPSPEEIQSTISYVLVDSQKRDLRRATMLSAPRAEYEAAVKCLQTTSLFYAQSVLDPRGTAYFLAVEHRVSNRHFASGQDTAAPVLMDCVMETDGQSALAQQLLQTGPADAQGQEDVESDVEDDPATVRAAESAGLPDSGHLLCSVIGMNDAADERDKCIRLSKELESLAEDKWQQGAMRNDAEMLHVHRANNELNAAGSSTDAPAPLLGREGAFERGVLRRVQRVQQHAKDMAGERRVQQQQYGVKPEKLVVPSEEHPSSMFDPGTWAMAYPDLFPYGDGVPFLVRETQITALEVFQYLLCRDELSYTGPGEASYASFLPVCYDVQRRLQLLRKSKAHVQRKGFSEHCNVIASVEPEALLKAIALKGEKADIRAIMQSPEVDSALKRALGDVLITTGDIVGMDGHRSQLRHRGHAAGWHFGSSTLFVTPNLADTRASLLLQLNSKAYALTADLVAEMPNLPTLPEMRRTLASDPVAQAKFFHLMLENFFLHVLGPGHRGAAARGRGSLHPHILLCLIGHDLTDRLSAILDRGAQGHLVIELERWSQSVKAAAERIRYDSQLTLAGQLGQSSDALPLSERQRQSAGAHYGDLPTQAVEPDGHEVRWTAAGCSGDLTLTGSYTTLRPIYLRRSSGLSSDAWKKSLVEDYRRLVIQNHYHRCTKSCHKNNLKKKRVGCRFGCMHLEIMASDEPGGKVKKLKYKGWPRARAAHFMANLSPQDTDVSRQEAACNEVPHVFVPQRDHPFEGMSHPTPQVTMRCNCDVKYLGRGIASEDFEKIFLCFAAEGDTLGADSCPFVSG
ncbi:unnamed protein product [Symbiodinium microadriaticum]|nr:unnamed protein product [Symbiodinium microadriaticum]